MIRRATLADLDRLVGPEWNWEESLTAYAFQPDQRYLRPFAEAHLFSMVWLNQEHLDAGPVLAWGVFYENRPALGGYTSKLDIHMLVARRDPDGLPEALELLDHRLTAMPTCYWLCAVADQRLDSPLVAALQERRFVHEETAQKLTGQTLFWKDRA